MLLTVKDPTTPMSILPPHHHHHHSSPTPHLAPLHRTCFVPAAVSSPRPPCEARRWLCGALPTSHARGPGCKQRGGADRSDEYGIGTAPTHDAEAECVCLVQGLKLRLILTCAKCIQYILACRGDEAEPGPVSVRHAATRARPAPPMGAHVCMDAHVCMGVP